MRNLNQPVQRLTGISAGLLCPAKMFTTYFLSYNFKLTKIAHVTTARVDAPHKSMVAAQCHQCQRYGHTQRYCKAEPKCIKCGQLFYRTANWSANYTEKHTNLPWMQVLSKSVLATPKVERTVSHFQSYSEQLHEEVSHNFCI